MATIVAFVTGKIVLKYCNISKSPGKGSINLPPPPVPQWGYEFVYTCEG